MSRQSLARLLHLRYSTTTTAAAAATSSKSKTTAIASYQTVSTSTLSKSKSKNTRLCSLNSTIVSSSHHHGLGAGQFSRNYSGEGELDVNKVVDEINQKFAEAREEVEAAMDSKETVYFNEEAEIARTAVQEVLDLFDGLLGKVESKQRESLMRSMGLKMEQLKAELQQLNE